MSPTPIRPGLARCLRSSAAEMQCRLDAKLATSERIKALWPKLSWRKRAERLGINEATLRGQLDPRALERRVSDDVLELLDHFEAIARLSGKMGAVG